MLGIVFIGNINMNSYFLKILFSPILSNKRAYKQWHPSSNEQTERLDFSSKRHSPRKEPELLGKVNSKPQTKKNHMILQHVKARNKGRVQRLMVHLKRIQELALKDYHWPKAPKKKKKAGNKHWIYKNL